MNIDAKIRADMRTFWLQRPERGTCRAPFAVELESGPIMVPCGNCMPCLRRKRLRYTGQCMAEAVDRPGSQVYTLTYSDEKYPAEITPAWIQNQARGFIRRLRLLVSDDEIEHTEPLKYWIVAQLGTVTDRFHFHVIVFPPPLMQLPQPEQKDGRFMPADPPQIQRYSHKTKRLERRAGLWSSGHRLVDELTTQSVGYVLGYIAKPGKGTVYSTKSQCLGEKYFRAWCADHRKLPITIPGCFYVQPNEYGQHPRWYPMSPRFREIADEIGYDFRADGTGDNASYRNFLESDGIVRRQLRSARDRYYKRKAATRPEKARESPAVLRLQEQFRAVGKK